MKRIETYVAFLDILGFKNIMMQNKEADLVKFISAMSNIQLNSYNELVSSIAESYKDELENVKEMFNIQTISLSDSIVIWTPYSSGLDFLNLIIYTSILLSNSFYEGFPLRGAVTYGEIFFSDITHSSGSTSNVFGKAIVRALELEKVQQWAGVVIDDVAVDRFKELSLKEFNEVPNEDLTNDHYFLYEIPKSTGKVEKHYALNWPYQFRNLQIDDLSFIESFSRHGKSIDNWNVRFKIANTIEFFKYANALNQKNK